MLVVRPTELFMKAFWPFITLLNRMGRAVVSGLGLRGAGRHALVHSEEELKMLVTASQEAGVLEENEEQMLHRVFGFADFTAGQVMTPRTELEAVNADAPLSAVLERLAAAGRPALPVYRNDLDTVIGILHATDVVNAIVSGAPGFTAASVVRETLTVPETMRADALLGGMRQRGVREAVVIDEYGGTAGLVTFESLMERIVGDLGGVVGRAQRIALRPDGSADIDGLALTADVNEQFALHIDEDTYTTVGGYVLGRLEGHARVGDTIDVEGRSMRVTSLDGLRVAKVWLSVPRAPAGKEAV
jgi:CBS domain containing-hemolysin-like protein